MRPILLLFAVWVAGCASTPQASLERDAEAKRFGTSPGVSTVYVYRPGPAQDETVLWVDGRLIGSTLPRAYFRIYLDPGRHVFTGMAADNGRLELETRPGEIYFVAQHLYTGQSLFQPVSQEIGRKVVANCCSLLENWTRGQRPLLR
jgi:hypothetical protein